MLRPAMLLQCSSLLERAVGSVLAPTLASIAVNATTPPVLTPRSTLHDAAALLSRETTAVLVERGGRVVGLVTPKSILKAAALGGHPEELRLADSGVGPPPYEPPRWALVKAAKCTIFANFTEKYVL